MERKLLKFVGDSLVLHADLSALAQEDLNDMVVDDLGVAFVGNFGYDASSEERRSSSLIRVAPNGDVALQSGDLFRPNGIVMLPDRSALIVAETRLGRLSWLDLGEDGSVVHQRTFAQMPSRTWLDGICRDAEGGVWASDPRNSRCLRILDGGAVTHEIATSMPAYACVLGGADRRTLFMCTGPFRSVSDAALDLQGTIEVAEVEVPGAGWP
jgi:sugar lactone lactonase YvrE